MLPNKLTIDYLKSSWKTNLLWFKLFFGGLKLFNPFTMTFYKVDGVPEGTKNPIVLFASMILWKGKLWPNFAFSWTLF